MTINYNPKIVTDGLVLCLDAASNRSYPKAGNTWYDISNNKANINLVNSPTFNNDNGGGIVLNGVNNYINGLRPNDLNFTGNFTFDIWMKFNSGDSIGGGAHIIGSNGRSDGLFRGADGNNTHLTIDGSGNLRVYTFNGGGGNTDYDTGFNINTQEICQVGMIHNSNSSKAGFKNGNISSFQSRWSTQNFSYFTIGGEHNEAGFFTQMNYANITVYSVKIYNRSLTLNEIKQNFYALRGRFNI